MSMEYVLQPIPGLEKSSNCFMGAFIYMMRYRGMEISESEVQLPYAGIRLNLSCKKDIYLKANFLQGIHNFCAENKIHYKEWEISSRHLKQSIHNILTREGAFMIALGSKDFSYLKSFIGDSVPHCVTVTGISEKGLLIADACAYPAHESVYSGIVPFSNIQELEQDCQVWVACVEGDHGGKKVDCEKMLDSAKKRFVKENVELEQGSRLKAGYDYCEYLYSNISDLRGSNLRKIAENIIVDTHIPQLRMIMQLFAREPEYYFRLSKLSNDWMLLVYRFVKESFEFASENHDVLIENYRALLLRERDIYEMVR